MCPYDHQQQLQLGNKVEGVTGLVINGLWVQLLATALLGSDPGQGAHTHAQRLQSYNHMTL